MMKSLLRYLVGEYLCQTELADMVGACTPPAIRDLESAARYIITAQRRATAARWRCTSARSGVSS
jgi:hypothetical protein